MFLRNWIFALVQEKYFLDAIVRIWESLEINPLDAETWLIFGHISYVTGDLESSRDKFEKALKIDPSFEKINEEL